MPRRLTTAAGADPNRGNASPFLFLPYDNSDNGTRPLSGPTPWYMCQAIHINGMPYTGVEPTIGDTVNVSLLIANSGDVDAIASAHLYYADPTTVFTPSVLASGNIAQWVQIVGASSQQETTLIPWTIPDTVPNHICLFAEVSCTSDPPILIDNVVLDRHYGQQNINVLMAKAGQKKAFTFHAANGEKEAATFHLIASPAKPETIRFLEGFYKADAVSLDGKALSLHVVQPGLRSDFRQELRLKLQSAERRMCQLIMDVPKDLQPHQFVAIEIEQTTVNNKEENKQHRGATLALIVFAER